MLLNPANLESQKVRQPNSFPCDILCADLDTFLAEVAGKSKSGPKDKGKEVSKQATLFNMLPPKAAVKTSGTGARTGSMTTEMSDADSQSMMETQLDEIQLEETQMTQEDSQADETQMSVDT
jgi:hypothetical protein